MKKLLLAVLFLAALPARAQSPAKETPRVYINGTGNQDVRTTGSAYRNWWGGVSGWSNSTVSEHDQTMELAKQFPKQCPSVTVTLNPETADYMVDLNHEPFKGIIHKNNQIMVVNRRGDLLMSNTTRAVSHSVNDACAAILADWAKNGRIEPPAPAPEVKPTPVPTTPTAKPAAPEMQMQTATPQQESLGEIARRLREKKATEKKPQR